VDALKLPVEAPKQLTFTCEADVTVKGGQLVQLGTELRLLIRNTVPALSTTWIG